MDMEKIIDKLWDLSENMVSAALLLIIGLIVIKVALNVARKTLAKSTLDESVHVFIISALKIALFVVLTVVVLTQLKVPTTPLVTVLGAGSAAIALALKDSLGNIAGGILILANKPFKKGDVIDIADINGVVQHIDLFVTTLTTADNKIITIPNGTINTSVIVNYSSATMRRVDCQFGIGYDSDIAKAKDVLAAVAESNPDIYKEPEPVIGVRAHQDSAVILDLKVWCDTEKYYDVNYYIQEQVKLAFDEANISIPYPQMDVHVVK